MINVMVLHRETIRAPPKRRSRKVITRGSEHRGVEPTQASSQRTNKAHYTWDTEQNQYR